jgi:hypothetical protein
MVSFYCNFSTYHFNLGSEDAIIISSDTLVLNPGLTTGSNQQMHDKMKKVERMTIRERLNGKPDKAIAHPGLVSHGREI